jgi:hypothetical protein
MKSSLLVEVGRLPKLPRCPSKNSTSYSRRFQKAEQELRDLQKRLERLQELHPIGSKRFTKAGIRKMVARLHEELALYEGSEEARNSKSNTASASLVSPS